MSLNDRMIASGFEKRYPYLWNQGLAAVALPNGPHLIQVDKDQPLIAGATVIGNFADLQVATTEAISAEFLHALGQSQGARANDALLSLIVVELGTLGFIRGRTS